MGKGASLELQALSRGAAAGDQWSQYQLGLRFEQGIGVPRDLRAARILYQRAAADSGGPVWAYVPGTRPGSSGRTVMLSNAPRKFGLAEAKARLEAMGPAGEGALKNEKGQ